jgi:hypothetical protein
MWLSALACREPDLPPTEIVSNYEKNVHEGAPLPAKAMLSSKQLSSADTLFVDVLAEEHNRQEEGVASSRRLSSMSGTAAKVVDVYMLRDQVKKTYTWDLVREGNRWKIDGWSVEAAAGPATFTTGS